MRAQQIGTRYLSGRPVPVFYAPDWETHLTLPLPCFTLGERTAPPWWKRLIRCLTP